MKKLAKLKLITKSTVLNAPEMKKIHGGGKSGCNFAASSFSQCSGDCWIGSFPGRCYLVMFTDFYFGYNYYGASSRLNCVCEA